MEYMSIKRALIVGKIFNLFLQKARIPSKK